MITCLTDEVNPTEVGIYVAYVNGQYPTIASRMFLYWDVGGWYHPLSDQRYRDHVYAWIGPLPVVKLES